MDIFKTVMLISSFLLLIAGCQQQGKEELVAYVTKIKAAPKSDIEPIPVMKAYKKFSYTASDLRNPFIPPVKDDTTEVVEKPIIDNGIHPDPYRLKEALESHELAVLKFVGTLEQNGEMWALIREPDSGVIHRVQVGNYMGQYDGEILTISDTELTLKEIVPEQNGTYKEKDTSLSIDGAT